VIADLVLAVLPIKKRSQPLSCAGNDHRIPDVHTLTATRGEICFIRQNTLLYEVSYPLEMRIIKYGKTTAYDPEERPG
jgi:hypothetical protein